LKNDEDKEKGKKVRD